MEFTTLFLVRVVELTLRYPIAGLLPVTHIPFIIIPESITSKNKKYRGIAKCGRYWRPYREGQGREGEEEAKRGKKGD